MPQISSQDLMDLARRVAVEAGFHPDLPPEASAELADAQRAFQRSLADAALRDETATLWSSIDNRDSRDLDQVEFAERQAGATVLRVAVADVSELVPAGSALDRRARDNGTTVYAGAEIFPMLPEELSTGLTSLLQDQERAAVVIEMHVDAQGAVSETAVRRSRLVNRARLVYDSIGAWIDGSGPAPERLMASPDLQAQIRLQDETARRLHALRQQRGALDFETIEASPVLENGRVVDLKVVQKSRARYIIEDFMIAANTAMATYLEDRGISSIQRVVRTPERWDRIVDIASAHGFSLPAEADSRALSGFLAAQKAHDPAHFPDLSLSIVKLLGPGVYTVVRTAAEREGHFGLAAQNYTHSTAPNRRYADLAIQRIFKAAATGSAAPYSDQELEQIAAHCTERENASRKVERRMRKAAAAALLGARIGQRFEAIVTGCSHKGTYVRTLSPPVEGRVVKGFRGLDVGDRVNVTLLAADFHTGFIDFAADG